MEDTKNMIERYKRELMDLMKSSPNRGSTSKPAQPAPRAEVVPETDSSPMTPVQPSPQPPQAEGVPRAEEVPESETIKQPRVIGYVEDDVRIPDEYGRLISEISDNDEVSEDIDNVISDEITENTDESVAQIEPEMPAPKSPQQHESAIGANPSDEELARGSRGTPIEYPEPEYESYEQFTERNIGRGTITFRVYTAREALPIKGARCALSKQIAGSRHEITEMLTDESGQTPPQTLPAPSKELSQHVENNIQPFALYDATVKMDGYANVILKDIPVFDGVQSIQRVAMVPDADDGESEIITEVPNANE
ncbi:MAG: hypothetical protein K2N06_12360 [Oscillospiraceae bacterium]|nr:hypothetical protein [Oscillospiraceae bacterium]